MRHICKKLKNCGGATIIFALLIFLLCALVGASALTAASANIGRYSHLEDDQQKYLSVSSAIDLLRGQLGDQTLEASLKLTETYTWKYVADSKLTETTTYKLDDASKLNDLTGWMKKLEDTFTFIFENKYVPSDFFGKPDAGVTPPNTTRPAFSSAASSDVTFTISGADGLSGKVDDVTVKVSLDGNTFDLLFSFYVGDEENKVYAATMRAPATVTPVGPIESVTQSEVGGSGQRVTDTTVKVSVVWRADDTVVVRDTNG